MDNKLSKQSIDRLDISDNAIKTLKGNNIKTIYLTKKGLVCIWIKCVRR